MNRLIKRAQEKDADAFVTLIKMVERDLYRVAKGYFKSEDDVADILQDTILACFENISSLKEPRYFKTWLIRILINKCNDLIGSRKRCAGETEFVDRGYVDNSQDNVDFMLLMDALDEKYRLVLLLYYAEGFRVREISELTGLSVDTVKGRLKRGRQKVKKEYEAFSKEALI